MSSQAVKPMPPMMMSSMTAMLMTGLAANEVSEEKGERTPIRSKPALQNAEIA